MTEFSSSTFDRYSGKWLIGTGVFELVLASLFLFFGATDEFLLFPFGLTAAILGITGFALVWFGLRARRSAAEAERISSTGQAGTAIVTGLTQTGMTLNDQPQMDIELMVSIPGRAPYAAKRKEFVPLMLLGRLSAGSPLPVKVDPSDPGDVIIDWAGPDAPSAPSAFASWPATSTVMDGGTTVIDGGTTIVGGADTMAQLQSALAARGMSAADQAATLARVQTAFASLSAAAATTLHAAEPGTDSVDRLRATVRATGTDATATIDKLVDTGRSIGAERLFTMQVTLHVPGGFDRQLPEASARVPLAAVSHMAVGTIVPVKIAIDDPDVIVFEWERLGTDGSILAPGSPTLL